MKHIFHTSIRWHPLCRHLLLFSGLLLQGGHGAQAAEPAASMPPPPSYDGPGAFGPLHGRVQLRELQLVGVIMNGEKRNALVRAPSGEIHRIGVGDYVGEHNGVIQRIEPGQVYIRQLLPHGEGRYEPRMRVLGWRGVQSIDATQQQGPTP